MCNVLTKMFSDHLNTRRDRFKYIYHIHLDTFTKIYLGNITIDLPPQVSLNKVR